MKFLVISILLKIITEILCNKRRSLVLELTDQTIDEFISTNENVLIIFTREDCPSCDQAIPHLIDLERRIITSKMDVKIAKISNSFKNVMNKYDILGFPTIKFLNKNYDIKESFTSEINADSLFNFINDKLKGIWQEVYEAKHFKLLEESNRLILLVCGSKITFPEIFVERQVIRSINEDIELFYTRDRRLYKILGCELNDILIIKQFDEYRSLYKYNGNYNRTEFHDWLEIFSFPLLLELNDDNLQMAMQKQLPTVILIKSAEEQPFLDKLIYESAGKNRVSK